MQHCVTTVTAKAIKGRISSGMAGLGEDGGEVGDGQRLPEEDRAVAAFAVERVEAVEDADDHHDAMKNAGSDVERYRDGWCVARGLAGIENDALRAPGEGRREQSRRGARRRRRGRRCRGSGSPRIRGEWTRYRRWSSVTPDDVVSRELGEESYKAVACVLIERLLGTGGAGRPSWR